MVLHNLLLDLNETWEPDEEEISAILREEGFNVDGGNAEGDGEGDADADGAEREQLSEALNNRRREELLLEFLRIQEEEAE